MKIRLTQIDGKLPNLALMKLSSYFKAQGHDVIFTESLVRRRDEPEYDMVFGSAIFTMSDGLVGKFIRHWPNAIVGGTGSGSSITVEGVIGSHDGVDYDIYPEFKPSIGFTARGCRMKCRFCVVPGKEGKPLEVNSVSDIWRGGSHPKKLLLLDNDFFGQPNWKVRVREINEGGFKVCLNQGINVRLINEESSHALASMQYRNSDFSKRILYTAWDNVGDERTFLRGIDMLNHAGIPCNHMMVYMLVGYDPDETWERIFYRFDAMVDRGMLPYPMVYDPSRKDLKHFQRWVITGLYRAVPWSEYTPWVLWNKKRSVTNVLQLPAAK